MRKAINAVKIFALEIGIGITIFALIGAAALVLKVVVLVLQYFQLPSFFIQALTAVEYLLFGVDLMLFLIFLLRSTIKMVKEIW